MPHHPQSAHRLFNGTVPCLYDIVEHVNHKLELMFVGALIDLEDLLYLEYPLIIMSVVQNANELQQPSFRELIIHVIWVLLPRRYEHLWLWCRLRLPQQKLNNLRLHGLLHGNEFAERTL